MKHTNHSQVVCPKCGHQFSQPRVNSEPTMGKLLHSFRCVECHQQITGAPLFFGGYFACEPCVIANYREHGPEVVKQELRERRFRAARLLQQQGKR